MAMVVRANRESDGIGGHISTYASAATLYEDRLQPFSSAARTPIRTRTSSISRATRRQSFYSRGFLEGRFSEEQLHRDFRHELRPGGGLSSYPHPWLMPDYWEFPTVSMGLGPLTAIYQARFARYLENRGLKKPSDQKIWAFLGDGETDEPEKRSARSPLAAREKLDNLIFVINCNLQRLDGPVPASPITRSSRNSKPCSVAPALERDQSAVGLRVGCAPRPRYRRRALARRMKVVDGEYQRYRRRRRHAYLRKRSPGHRARLLEDGAASCQTMSCRACGLAATIR